MNLEELTGRKPGEPVPQVDPSDIKATWNLHRETAARNPGKQFAIGNSVVENICKPGADIHAVRTRTARLAMIVDVFREQLAPWIRDGEFDNVVFRAVAQTPMKWVEIGVVFQGLPFDAEDFLRRVREER